MLSRLLSVLAAGILTCVLIFAPAGGQAERLPALRVVQSGHSLTDPIIAPLTRMVQATSIRGGALDKATIPGSPMDWRWANATRPDIRDPDVMAGYDVLAITERVPLSTTLEPHKSREWALRWYNHAWTHGNSGRGARSVLYASWVDINSGSGYDNRYNDPEGEIPFRDRLSIEMDRWDAILKHVNQNRPDSSPVMQMIPGPLIMARAYDEISAGRAPGLGGFDELFTDHIHLNAMGAYMIALAHYAVIYDADPRGLPHGVPARGGPSKEQAAWMQSLVWDVLGDYRAKAGG